MDYSGRKDKAAKVIRVITVPPVMVLILLLVVYRFRTGVYRDIGELLCSILFLMLIPVLAYPIAFAVPKLRAKGREGQRNLAFVMNAAGYLGAVIWGKVRDVSAVLMQVFWTYFLSVCILLVINKVIRLRASGHACSIAGPLILMVYLLDWKVLFPCALVFSLIIWASLRTKRHTPKELLFGSLCALIAFGVSFFPMLF